MPATVTQTFTLEPELLEAARALAEAEDRSLSSLIRHGLRRLLEQHAAASAA